MEIWKDVIGYEGLYQVSNFGRVKNIKKPVQIIMKNNLTPIGYHLMRVSKNNIQKGFRVHRLVAIHFIPNPENKREVNHKNGVKTDNRVENLEWVTSSENSKHAVKNGFHKGRKGEKHHSVKIKEQDAIFIKYGSEGISSRELSEKYNLHVNQINDIKAGRKWKHI